MFFNIFFWIYAAFASSVPAAQMSNPSDSSSQVVRDSAILDVLTDKLNYQLRHQKPEKCYLQTDRTLYSPGETIWYAAWLRNAGTLDPSATSDVLYVHLIDGKGVKLQTQTLFCTEFGTAGSIELPSNMAGGQYKINAFTSWMQNTQSVFSRDITVQKVVLPNLNMKLEFERKAFGPGEVAIAKLDLLSLENKPLSSQKVRFVAKTDGIESGTGEALTDANGRAYIRFPLPSVINTPDGLLNVLIEHGGKTESISRAIPIVLNNVNLQFFPEGGDAVAGLPCHMAFKATNEIGKPTDLEGYIIDGKGTKVADFMSFHDGMGAFGFTPQPGERYFAQVTKPFFSASTYALPEIQGKGQTLQLKQSTDQTLVFRASAAKREKIIVVGTHQDHIFFYKEITTSASGTEFNVNISELPMGIARFTLMDSDKMPQAERLVFVQKDKGLQIEIYPEKEKYLPREKVKMHLKVKDHTGKPVKGSFGMAVVDDKQLSFADDKQGHILAALLLQQDVKGVIEEPNFYFDKTEPKSDQALDFLLMTQGWRRFDWKEALADTKVTYEYGAEITPSPKDMKAGKLRRKSSGSGISVLEGIVRDENEEILIGVTIQLKKGRVSIQGTITDVKGKYSLKVEPGEYDIIVSYTGYMAKKFTNIVVQKGMINELDACLGEPILLEQVNITSGKVSLIKKDKMSMAIRPGAVKEMDPPAPKMAPPVPKLEENPIINLDFEDDSAPLMDEMVMDGEIAGEEMMLAKEEKADKPQASMEARKQKRQSAPYERFTRARTFYVPAYEAADPVTQRSDFRKTIYWNPAVETDEKGEGMVSFFASDEITNFRVTVEGVNRSGAVGRAEKRIFVQKPFHMSLQLPASVITGDVLRMAVQVHNNTSQSMGGKLALTVPEHFTLEGKPDLYSNVAAGKTQTIYLDYLVGTTKNKENMPIVVSLTQDENIADAFESSIKTINRGFPVRKMVSGNASQNMFEFNLNDPVEGTATMNLTACPNALQTILVGMERMLRQPNGCFEQVSSSNYPNLLVLDLLRSSGKVMPETESKALQLLEDGYKRLTAYESKSGGFDWWGRDPGHEGLTAYGILQFTDMAAVYSVDKAMIQRSTKWLLDRREGTGGWKINPNCLHSWTNDGTLGAYIAWAIASAGEGASITAEINESYKIAKVSKDAYQIALMANAFSATKDPRFSEMVALLRASQTNDGSWTGSTHSAVGSTGTILQLETTALATLALITEGKSAAAVAKAISFITNQKNEYGYGSTQSTVLCLKALVKYAQMGTSTAATGNLIVQIDGKEVVKHAFDSSNPKRIEIKGLEQHLKGNQSKVEVFFEPSTEVVPFDIELNYASRQPRTAPNTPFDFQTSIEKVKASVGETVRLTANLQNNSDQVLASPMIILGIPAGLTLQPWQLKSLKDAGKYDYYELWDGFAVFHFEQLKPKEVRTINLDLRADITGSFEAPASQAFLYYNNAARVWSKPERITVVE